MKGPLDFEVDQCYAYNCKCTEYIRGGVTPWYECDKSSGGCSHTVQNHKVPEKKRARKKK